MTTVVMEPIVRDTGHGTSGVCQVVLFNDNHNAFDHVVRSLISVFKHSGPMAEVEKV
jgi:hypothetical protein